MPRMLPACDERGVMREGEREREREREEGREETPKIEFSACKS